jgi:Glucan phosphorylase
MFPGYKIRAISNGVHLPTWAHESFRLLFTDHFPAWAHEPEAMVRLDQLPDDGVWQPMRWPNPISSGWSGSAPASSSIPCSHPGLRPADDAYKRPDLLFTDLDQLLQINSRHPFQLVMAGKSHPNDGSGKYLIRRIHDHIGELRHHIRIAYLPNYDMELAKTLVSGTDVWLNTPEPRWRLRAPAA